MCRFDYVLTGTRGRSTKTGKLYAVTAPFTFAVAKYCAPSPTLLGSDRTAHAPR